MSRGFEVVVDSHRWHKSQTGNTQFKRYVEGVGFLPDIQLPTRSDPRSAGYDFYLVEDLVLLPMQKTIVWSDVKAYMEEDEVLQIYIRSSIGIKHGLMIPNNVGIIDSSYYSNPDNDGNIAISLVNTTGQTVKLPAGSRIAQGIFMKYLVADGDAARGAERVGGIGSSGI